MRAAHEEHVHAHGKSQAQRPGMRPPPGGKDDSDDLTRQSRTPDPLTTASATQDLTSFSSALGSASKNSRAGMPRSTASRAGGEVPRSSNTVGGSGGAPVVAQQLFDSMSSIDDADRDDDDGSTQPLHSHRTLHRIIQERKSSRVDDDAVAWIARELGQDAAGAARRRGKDEGACGQWEGGRWSAGMVGDEGLAQQLNSLAEARRAAHEVRVLRMREAADVESKIEMESKVHDGLAGVLRALEEEHRRVEGSVGEMRDQLVSARDQASLCDILMNLQVFDLHALDQATPLSQVGPGLSLPGLSKDIETVEHALIISSCRLLNSSS